MIEHIMAKKITFLGIETSCDETAAAVIRENDKGTADILSNIVSSQIEEHKKFGGVVPELAARAHLENIEYIIDTALKESKISLKDLDGVAIFGSNDHMCFGFIKEAFENNYKIPTDYIIAGYDDLSFCESITPELTSVSTNFEGLAKRAIKTIENMINDKSDIVGQISMIPVKIKIRKSTKP